MSRPARMGREGWDPGAAALVAAVALGVAAAGAWLPAPDQRPRPVGMIEVGEVTPVMFAVSPGTPEVRLLVVGSVDGVGPVDEPVPVAAEVVWLDGDGRVVRSHPARWAAVPSQARPGWLDPRSLTLAPPEGARALVLRAASGVGQLQVRAWGAAASARDPGVAALRLDAQDAALLPHRLGLNEGALTADELAALLRVRWEPLRPLDRRDMPVVGALAALDDDRTVAAVRRAEGLVLAPGRAVAWTAVGSGWLEADGDVELVAVVEGLGAVTPGVEASGGRLAVAMPGPGSLWVRAGAAATRVRWVVADVDAALGQEVVPEGDGWVVLPPRGESVVQAAVEGTAWTLPLPPGVPDHVLRLGLRAVGEAAEVEVRVEHGDRVVRHTLLVEPGDGDFEEARQDGARGPWAPVGAAERWWLTVGAGAARVVVRASQPVVVDAAAEGPPVGTVSAMDEARRTVWRHRAELVSTWRPLPGAGVAWRLRANTRREPVGEDAWASAVHLARTPSGWVETPPAPRLEGGEADRAAWRTVRPLLVDGAAPAESWMLEGAGRGAVWCPVAAGAEVPLRWRGDAAGGVMAVRVVAAGAPGAPAAGAAWRLLADGHGVAGGALATAVGAWSGRPAPFDAVALEAIAGAVAWVRSGDAGCVGALADRAATAAAGRPVRWRVVVPPEGARLSLGGVVAGATVARVRVIGDAPAEGLAPARTLRERTLTLAPTTRGARSVAQPWREAWAAAPAPLRLEADVGGAAVVEVITDGPAWLWLVEPGEAEDAPLVTGRVRE
jgi:hypothetical protein